MPTSWSKIVIKDTDDEYLRLNYIKMNVVLWGSVQELMKEVDDSKKEIRKLKKDGSDDEDEALPKAKAKPKATSKN